MRAIKREERALSSTGILQRVKAAFLVKDGTRKTGRGVSRETND